MSGQLEQEDRGTLGNGAMDQDDRSHGRSASDASASDDDSSSSVGSSDAGHHEPDSEPPQDNFGNEGRRGEEESDDDEGSGSDDDGRGYHQTTAAKAKHKRRSKKRGDDNENSVTRQLVYGSRMEAHRNRTSVRLSGGGQKGKLFSTRNLDFDDLKRSESQREAMSPFMRLRASLTPNLFNESGSDPDGETEELNRQYTIPPPQDEDMYLIKGLRAFLSFKFRDLIFWLFKTSFINVIMVALMLYLVFVNFFTLIIYGVVHRASGKGTECIGGWDYDGTGEGRSLNWELSFSLSWTSFSTVGFGTTSPDTLAGCYGIRYTCAIEAFLGVLYAGFCGAIFFAKFSRLMGRAQVTFSSTLCIQFSNGVCGGRHEESLEEKSVKCVRKKMPYPVLEFRIVNERANDKGCEILDATISCLVCVHQASDDPKDTSKRSSEEETPSRLLREESTALSFDDTPDEKVSLMKQKYHNLNLHTRHHPYFRRVWYIRHELNASSPLLRREVRKKIKLGGQWPPYLSTHESVRASLVRFHDIIVTLNGTSNLNASDVFAQYRYKLRDLHVGWQFAGMMYFTNEKQGMNYFTKKGKEKKMKVDTSLIHDILPQAGGGNEPIGVTMYG